MGIDEIRITKFDKKYLNYLQHCAYYRWLSVCRVEAKAIEELIAEAFLEGKERGSRKS